MEFNMESFGIVVCNFNKIDYLKGCLKSLFQSDFNNINVEVIVVDNASTDGSAEFVKNNYPNITLLENKENMGGSGGFSKGMLYAIEKKFDFIALLDNDILLEKDTLLNLVNYLKEHPEVGVAGSKICTMDNPEILQELGSFIEYQHPFNVKTPLKSHIDNESLPDIVECDYVPACCLVTTGEVLKKVGVFDIRHFIYWDDMDWCTRVKQAGYKIHAINKSRVFHKMGAKDNTTTFGLYYFERNRALFYIKHLEDKNFDSFIDSYCQGVVRNTFFSNMKSVFSPAITLLKAIDDLFIGNLGRQDESVLTREKPVDMLDKFNISVSDKIAIFLCSDMILNRRVFDYLKVFFENVTLLCMNDDISLAKDNFNSEFISIYNEDSASNFKSIFFVMEHIMDFHDGVAQGNNFIYIDVYTNMAKMSDIKDIVSSYAIYNSIFNNMYKPVFAGRFHRVREILKENNAI